MDKTYSLVRPVLESYQACFLLLVGFGGLAILLAVLFNYIRARVFADSNNLDSSFDAGGNVTASLTAVTVAVQLLWPADLLQSASVTAKYGVAGAFWYSTAVVVNIILFPLLSITFKTRAPGAKTYLQIIRARFGRNTHIVYCAFALLTNLVVTSVLLVAGQALYKSLISDISDELIFILIAALFGSYALIGGVGSTFYVSYANAAVTFIILCYFIIKLFYASDLPFGSLTEIYNNVSRLEGPVGNKERNYMTFMSLDAFIWMVQGLFVGASIIFCDQASWQSRIAAKPLQGVIGFFFATFIWFAIPSTIGTTSGLIYLAYSQGGNNSNALTAGDIDAGLVTTFVAQSALGDAGGVMLLIMFTMLMMATGSGEVMAITSIIIYDIYQIYIFPFRKDIKQGHCILCNKPERDEYKQTNSDEHADCKPSVEERRSSLDVYCICPSVKDCEDCQADLSRQESMSAFDAAPHRCPVHGAYRLYQDSVMRARNWIVLAASLALVPLGLLLVASGIDLNWILLTGSVITIQTFPGVVLAIVWVKTRGWALIVGGVSGLVCGTAACLYRASTLDGGLSEFLLNTSEGYSVMTGACTSFLVSLVLDIVLSACSHRIISKEDEAMEWQKLRDIDNPLRPWKDQFHDEFPTTVDKYKPSFKDINMHFRKAKTIAVVGTVFCIVLFVFLIPGCMASLSVLTFDQIRGYLVTLQIWTAIMAALVLISVPVEEILLIVRHLRRKSV